MSAPGTKKPALMLTLQIYLPLCPIIKKQTMEDLSSSTMKKLIPKIYDDALRPSIIEVGKSVKDTVKLALKPYNGIIWSIDKSMDWLTNTISNKVKDYHLKKIKSPNIETTIKVVQGVMISGALENPIPRHLFANLLFSEMDAENDNHSHPAYAEILKQISQEECKILCVIANRPVTIFWTRTVSDNYFSFQKASEENIRYLHETNDLFNKCFITDDMPTDLYMENLNRLGIIEIKKVDHASMPGSSPEEDTVYDNQITLFNQFIELNKGKERLPLKANVLIVTIRPTPFAYNFLGAIGASEFYNHDQNTFITPNWIKEE
jgi:hypothetical protein